VQSKLRRGFHTLIIWQVAVCIILIGIFPYRPNSWVLLIFLALPCVLGLEYVGAALLYYPRLAGRKRAARLTVALAAMLVLAVGIISIWHLIKPELDVW
jgi:hypothetical protein